MWKLFINRSNIYWRLMRLDKPIGILLLLWPTLWALWLSSNGRPDLVVLGVFVVGTVLMRSAGCVINDLADRKFDGHVERTCKRPLATGEAKASEALALFAALVLLAFGLVIWLGNDLVIGLSIPAVLLAASYPYTKRVLAIPQAYLGVAFGFGIPMAFAAHGHAIPNEAWLLLSANVFWAVAYDTEYAMVDRPDDLKIGIKTSAITFGRFDVFAVMICYGMTVVLVALVGMRLSLSVYFYMGLIGVVGIMAVHYQWIRTRDRQACFKAFLHNNVVGCVIFLAVLSGYWQR
jgi:4-hydroxybenzoate polyprenyltransferase